MAPSGPKHRSLGKRNGSPLHSVATVAKSPSIVSLRSEGVLDSATQITPSSSTANPLGRPVFRMTDLVLPSLLSHVTQPRSAPPSTINHVPSGKATGPSGACRSPAKIIGFSVGRKHSKLPTTEQQGDIGWVKRQKNHQTGSNGM